MNWYKQQSVIQKEAGFWGGVAGGMIVGLAVWLGLSQAELYQLKQQHQGNEQDVVQTLKEEVQRQGGDPIQIIQKQQSQPETEVQPKPTYPPQSEKPKPEEAQKPKEKDYFNSYIKRFEKREARWTKAYDDKTGKAYTGGPRKGVITVGVGHAMGANPTDSDRHAPRSRRVFKQLFGDDVNWDNVYNGKQELSQKQVDALAKLDIEEHAARAEKLIPNLSQQSEEVQEMAIDAAFRGDLGPKASALISVGNWMPAAKEYLNHKQYHNAEELGIRGIIPRMEENASKLVYQHIVQNNVSKSEVPGLLKHYGLPQSIMDFIYH